MKEKTSMNQEKINVLLFDNNGADTLRFDIPNIKDGIAVNLNKTSGQIELKRVFEELLKYMNLHDIVLELTIDSQYKKGLFKEVCTEYISDLNNEIHQIKAEIVKL